MTHVYIIQRNYDYEGSVFVDVCIDDLELAKRLAQADSEDKQDDIILDWYQSPYTDTPLLLADIDGSRNYSIGRCEVTEQ